VSELQIKNSLQPAALGGGAHLPARRAHHGTHLTHHLAIRPGFIGALFTAIEEAGHSGILIVGPPGSGRSALIAWLGARRDELREAWIRVACAMVVRLI
jgi:hypothetical protein